VTEGVPFEYWGPEMPRAAADAIGTAMRRIPAASRAADAIDIIDIIGIAVQDLTGMVNYLHI
jgi:hypothetical protein